MMATPLMFNLFCVAYLQCKSGLIRVDEVNFCKEENNSIVSSGRIKSTIISVRMSEPRPQAREQQLCTGHSTPCFYLVSIEGGKWSSSLRPEITAQLKLIFERANFA